MVNGIFFSAKDRKQAFQMKEDIEMGLGKEYVKDVVKGQKQAFFDKRYCKEGRKECQFQKEIEPKLKFISVIVHTDIRIVSVMVKDS